MVNQTGDSGVAPPGVSAEGEPFMSRLGDLIGRKPPVEDRGTQDRAGDAEPANPPHQDDNILELDPELFAPIASQLGRDNERVRNLMADAEHRINELDAVKQAIVNLIEPVNKTLRDFEAAKSVRLSLQTVLNTTRVAYGKLRSETSQLQKRAETLEGECTRLQEDLSIAQDYVGSLEAA